MVIIVVFFLAQTLCVNRSPHKHVSKFMINKICDDAMAVVCGICTVVYNMLTSM
jgi:hypothetical protein